MTQQKQFSGSVILIMLVLGGCGGGGGSSDDFNPSSPCNVILTIATGGLSCALGVITGLVPTTTTTTTTTPTPTPTPTTPTSSPPTNLPPGGYVFRQILDLEPNDDLSTASFASFPPRPDSSQRVGFHVDGTINSLTDAIDAFALTSSESRLLSVELCMSGGGCGAPTRLDVGVAFIEVLDQFGTVLWTTEPDLTQGNLLNIAIDAGVLYYVTIVAENTFGNDTGYFLRVSESTDAPDPTAPLVLTPTAPILSVSGAPSMTVMLDWVPPSTNTDGSALLGLSGYTISYADVSGPCCGSYPTTEIDVDNLGLVIYVLDLPGSGEWAINMTARNSSGQVSAASNTVTVTTDTGVVDDPWAIPVAGQIVSYRFSTGVSSGSGNLSLASLFSGANVAGTFDYDNGALVTTSGMESTGYQGGLVNLVGSVNGSSFSDPGGVAIVSDDRYAPPAARDMLQLNAGALYFSGFDAGGYTLVGVRIFWLEGENGISDFLTGENLPTALPRFEGRLALDFVSTIDPTDRDSVFFDGVFVTPAG